MPTTVAEFRVILNDKGFAIVNDLTEEGRSELLAEGYLLFFFDTETSEGVPVIFAVATSPDKSYREAEKWFFDTVIDPKTPVEEIGDLDPANFGIFTTESIHIPFRPFYVVKRGMSTWDEVPQFFDGFMNRVLEVTQDKLDSDGLIFLNDVFAMLDLPKTRIGQLFGWKEGETITVETDNVLVETEYGKGPGYKLTFPTAHYILDQIGD